LPLQAVAQFMVAPSLIDFDQLGNFSDQ